MKVTARAAKSLYLRRARDYSHPPMAFPKSLGVGATLLLLCLPVAAKVHSVALGAWRKIPHAALDRLQPNRRRTG